MGKKINTMMNHPLILIEGKHTLECLKNLKKSYPVWAESDIYEIQLQELFEISNPTLIFSKDFRDKQKTFVKKRLEEQKKNLKGAWIYFPWSGRLIHMLPPNEYFTLRTNRNRNLIGSREQKRLMNFCVGVVGLSVGSNIATTLSYTGIANKFKFCEFDTLETSNLNRIKARVDQVGMKKIDIVAQQVYEINPFAEISLLEDAITRYSLKDFILSKPKPQLIFEIMDSFETKIHLHSIARENGIPVVMITNLGDRVLIDVERYDLNRKTPLFNGRAGKIPANILKKPDISVQDKHRYAVALAGVKNIPKRALESVQQIGHTLVGRPQLASTVTVAAGLSTYIARKIALGENLPSASWLINFDKIFNEKSSNRL